MVQGCPACSGGGEREGYRPFRRQTWRSVFKTSVRLGKKGRWEGNAEPGDVILRSFYIISLDLDGRFRRF